jgi:hypothetical protein
MKSMQIPVVSARFARQLSVGYFSRRHLMRRLISLLLLVTTLFQQALAEGLVPTVDGETFAKTSVAKPANGDRLFEFIRDEETFDKWTKLVAYRYQRLPGLRNDPIEYAFAMERVIRQQNPAAPVKVIKNEGSYEAILDFLTWPKDQSYMELNVFRFGKSKDGSAVVSVQLASRFVPPKPTFSQDGVNEYERQVKVIRDRRTSWIKHVIEADLQLIEAELLKER